MENNERKKSKSQKILEQSSDDEACVDDCEYIYVEMDGKVIKTIEVPKSQSKI